MERTSPIRIQDIPNVLVEQAAVSPISAAKGDEDLSKVVIQEHLNGEKPEYMIPDQFRTVVIIPAIKTNKMEKYKQCMMVKDSNE